MFAVYLLNDQYRISNGFPPAGAVVFFISSSYADAQRYFLANCPKRFACLLNPPAGIVPPTFNQIFLNDLPLGIWTIESPGVYKYLFPVDVFPPGALEAAAPIISSNSDLLDVAGNLLTAYVQPDGLDTLYVVTSSLALVETAWDSGELRLFLEVWPHQ